MIYAAVVRGMQIEVEDVTMKYVKNTNGITSLKEYVVSSVRHKIKKESFTALDNITFSVEKGEIFGIIGSNGAGKSTLLKVIAGILKPTSGKVTVSGTIVPMLELGSGFDQDLTGRENIFLNGAIFGYSEEFLKKRYYDIVEFSGLNDFIDEPIRTYSSGMTMRLAFSIASVVEPEILIVDEILAVGDESFQRKSRKKMAELMSGGTTVLIVSHDIGQIRDMCTRVLWLEHGKAADIGDTEKVCAEYEKAGSEM